MKNSIYTKEKEGRTVRVRICDQALISEKQMTGIRLRLNHLGYDFPDTDSVREYFERGVLLREDQSKAVISVMENRPFRTRNSIDTVRNTMARAKRKFGATRDWNRAGYILPDGTLLDFSDGQYRRVMDHREISCVVRGLKDDSRSAGMIRFMNLGAIRCQENGIDVSTVPTTAQESVLLRRMKSVREKGEAFYLDISNEAGYVAKSFEYGPFNTSGIVGDIRRYFETVS